MRLLALLACRDDHGRIEFPRDPPDAPSATGATAETGAAGPTGDTAVPPVVFPDDCDPVVHPVVPLGVSYEGVIDPHAEVYGAAPIPYAVRYSWPGTDPSVSASFVWRTDLDTLASTLELRPVGGALSSHEGASFTYSAHEVRIHEVKLCLGLTPGTSYEYRVGGAGGWSPFHTFRTPGPPGSFDTFRIAVSGDSRGAWSVWGTVVEQMEAHDPDFYVFTGDAVVSGWSQEEWDAWFAAAGDAFTGKALVMAQGNHDYLSTNWFSQFSYPGNEQWYRFDYGTLHLEILNDSAVGGDPALAEEGRWLEEGLATSSAPWKVAVHHKAAFSTSARHGSYLPVRELWVPLFDAGGVDLVLSGHNHVYERSLPVLGGAVAEPGPGITYLVSGGAGAELYDDGAAEFFSNVVAETEHYVILDFGPGEVHGVARDLAGNVIDDFTIPVD